MVRVPRQVSQEVVTVQKKRLPDGTVLTVRYVRKKVTRKPRVTKPKPKGRL